MRKLKTLDLFSGIGGFALALKPFSKIVGYCEIDDYCRKVLSARMVTGDIDTAPIFSDVTTLDMQVISKLRPVMLTAGKYVFGQRCSSSNDLSRMRSTLIV